jgi:hypothetical protein
MLYTIEYREKAQSNGFLARSNITRMSRTLKTSVKTKNVQPEKEDIEKKTGRRPQKA